MISELELNNSSINPTKASDITLTIKSKVTCNNPN